ncbi:MAG: IS3 family transposase [Anaerobutyricum hallii]
MRDLTRNWQRSWNDYMKKHPDMGYRRLNDKLRHDEDIQVNDKRILRICRKTDPVQLKEPV